MEILYWPLMDLLLWGFISLYLARYQAGLPNFVAFLLGALILWDILFPGPARDLRILPRRRLGPNSLNLFVSPLKPSEYLVSLMMVSTMKIVIAGTIMSVLAWFLYSFNIFLIGMSLVPFVLCLIALGWAIGIFTTSLILRFGQQAEVLALGDRPPLPTCFGRFLPRGHPPAISPDGGPLCPIFLCLRRDAGSHRQRGLILRKAPLGGGSRHRLPRRRHRLFPPGPEDGQEKRAPGPDRGVRVAGSFRFRPFSLFDRSRRNGPKRQSRPRSHPFFRGAFVLSCLLRGTCATSGKENHPWPKQTTCGNRDTTAHPFSPNDHRGRLRPPDHLPVHG